MKEKMLWRDPVVKKPTPVPHEEDASLADSLTKRQLESTPQSPSKQHELVNQEQTGWTNLDSMDIGLQASNDVPSPLR